RPRLHLSHACCRRIRSSIVIGCVSACRRRGPARPPIIRHRLGAPAGKDAIVRPVSDVASKDGPARPREPTLASTRREPPVNETLDRRLRTLPGIVRRALAPRAALRDWHGALGGVQTAPAVARTLVTHLSRWQPEVRWALALADATGGPAVIAAHGGGRLRGRTGLLALAAATIAAADHAGVGSLRTLAPRGPDGAAIGWLLRGRREIVGVV